MFWSSSDLNVPRWRALLYLQRGLRLRNDNTRRQRQLLLLLLLLLPLLSRRGRCVRTRTLSREPRCRQALRVLRGDVARDIARMRLDDIRERRAHRNHLLSQRAFSWSTYGLSGLPGHPHPILL